MTVWDDVVGQQDAVAVLDRAARAAATPGASGMTHAWLITGPPGSGRSNAARAFAAALQCQWFGCGECHACVTALSGGHADVSVIATEHVFLRVDDVRPLIQLAQRSPSEGRWRVIIVEDADRLNDSSGNMLLKAVEEPPERTVWVLCAPSPQDVLTTIRSRCRQVGLRIPPPADVTELLIRRDGVDPGLAAFAARAAQSHVGLARRLAKDENTRNRRREVLMMPRRLKGAGSAVVAAADLLAIATDESKASTGDRNEAEKHALMHSLGADGTGTIPPALRAQLRELEDNQKRRATRALRDVIDRSLVDLLSLYRDVLVLQFRSGVELVNAGMEADLETEAAQSDPATTLRRMEMIGQARERIAANVSPLLALEAMMVSLVPPQRNQRGRTARTG